MDTEKLRAWWWRRQGLDGSLRGSTPAEVLEKTGWARSVGGVGPYLTLLSRGGVGREAADAAVANLEIHELPAARACTYVVPASDFGFALKLSQGFAGGDMNQARKLGVTDAEIDRLCEEVVRALEQGLLEPDGIKDAVGSAVRNLGEAGKKKGISTTLPLALGRLQSEGEIRRVPVNGRLDQQRYRYTLWRPNPLVGFAMAEEELSAELAKRYFSWIGPATLGEFQWFSGLGVKASKAAVAPLKLEDVGENRLLLPEDREAFEAFRAPVGPDYSLVSSLDGLFLLRRDVLNRDGGKASLTTPDLPSHAIVDRGSLVGLWEYEPETESIAWMAFVPKTAGMKAAVERMQDFVRAELGDARSFSLDSTKSRAPRIAALRAGRVPA
jgi:hypothetical protein